MYLLTTIVYPLVCLALFAGFGALAFRAADLPVKPFALLPIGLASFIVIGQAMAWLGVTTPLNVIVIAAAAIAGLILLFREEDRSAGSDGSWVRPAICGFVATGVVLAPVLLTGRATLAGFLLDSTAGMQMLGADHLVHSGADFSSVGRESSSEAFLTRYFFDAIYPYGSHVVLGLTGAAVGSSLLWIYTPMMAVMAGVSATGLFGIARRFGLGLNLSVLAGILAAVPALTYAFLLQGSIKEVVFVPCLIAGSLVLLDPELRATRRQVAVAGGICLGAMFATIGVGAIAWAAPLGLGYAVLSSRPQDGWNNLRPRDFDWRALVLTGATIAAVLLIAIAPKFPSLIDEIDAARGLSQTNAQLAADPGNLTGPIGKKQAVGVWIGGTHRAAPRFGEATDAIIGAGIVLCLLGLVVLARDRRRLLLAWLAVLGLVWLALTHRGTMWLDAKLVMINSFAVVLLTLAGADRLRLALAGRNRSSLTYSALPAILAVGLFAFGVAASNAMQYRGTGILPTDRYDELQSIGEDFKNDGPGFIPDFDEYALYMLRKIKVSGPGHADSGAVNRLKTDGTKLPYGYSVDPDHLELREFSRLNLVVSRRGPWRSNPGAQFEPARQGDFYDVWRRNPDINEIEHLPLGKQSYVGVPRCRDVARLKSKAAATDGARLMAAIPGAPVSLIPRTMIDFEGAWAATARGTGILDGSGTMTFQARVLPGQQLWWQGNIDRPVTIISNGRKVGTIGRQSGGNGSTIGPVKLPAGEQTITIERGHGTLAPGDHSSTMLDQLALAAPTPSKPVDVSRRATADLCSSQLDWLAIAD